MRIGFTTTKPANLLTSKITLVDHLVKSRGSTQQHRQLLTTKVQFVARRTKIVPLVFQSRNNAIKSCTSNAKC